MTAVIIDTVRAIDEIFIQIAEVVPNSALPIDDVVEELWAALARGDLHLAVEAGRLRVEPLPPPWARGGGGHLARVRLRLARTYHQIIETRLRVLEGRL